ncbi:MAG: hypothetical protein ACT4NT_02335 [Nitrososphaerota archaeon]
MKYLAAILVFSISFIVTYAHAIPPLYTIEDLQTLSKYVLKGEIIDIKSNEITIKVHDHQEQNMDNMIKFKAANYTIMKPTTVQDLEKFRVGEDVYLFLLNKKPDSANNYSGFVASKYVIAEGIAYDVVVGKQASPLKQLKSGIASVVIVS